MAVAQSRHAKTGRAGDASGFDRDWRFCLVSGDGRLVDQIPAVQAYAQRRYMIWSFQKRSRRWSSLFIWLNSLSPMPPTFSIEPMWRS